MNRVAVFAHFDEKNEVKPYVLHYLERLREQCSRVVLVSTSPLGGPEIAKARRHASDVLVKDNVGWDFGMWKHALEQIPDIAVADELVLTNSSVFGPIHPLGPVFERMGDHPCHFWGMTDNFEYRWHLQSYFLVLKRPVLRSKALRLFFENVLPYRSKGQVILSYEVGLTTFLAEHDFVPAAFAPTDSWASWPLRRRMDLERRWNPTLFYPERLIARGMPFVKVMLLRDNVGRLKLDGVYDAMKSRGYDLSLVPFDRESKEPDPNLRTRLRRIWSRLAVETEGPSLAR